MIVFCRKMDNTEENVPVTLRTCVFLIASDSVLPTDSGAS